KPDVTNLILCIHSYRLVWELVDDGLVSLDRCIVGSLLLTCKANIKLCSRCVFFIWRSADNIGENSHRTIQRPRERNPQNPQFFAVQINFTHAELSLNRVVEMCAARISFDQLEV